MHKVTVYCMKHGILVYEKCHASMREAIIDFELHDQLMSDSGFNVELSSL